DLCRLGTLGGSRRPGAHGDVFTGRPLGRLRRRRRDHPAVADCTVGAWGNGRQEQAYPVHLGGLAYFLDNAPIQAIHQALSTAFTTRALVTGESVSVSSRPLCRYVTRSWSSPSWCSKVACRSGTLTRSTTAA